VRVWSNGPRHLVFEYPITVAAISSPEGVKRLDPPVIVRELAVCEDGVFFNEDAAGFPDVETKVDAYHDDRQYGFSLGSTWFAVTTPVGCDVHYR